MKEIIFTLAVSLVALTVPAQALDPVQWEFTIKKRGEGLYEFHATAVMEYPWHIYSQYSEEGGPVATEFRFEDSPGLTLLGEPGEVGALIKKYEPLFMVDTRYYEGEVDFIQKIRKNTPGTLSLEGGVTFMACTEEQCLMPKEVGFKVKLD